MTNENGQNTVEINIVERARVDSPTTVRHVK